MQIDEKTFDILMYQYDYGVPINFEAGAQQGFSIGDEIIFAFKDDRIADRRYTVDIEDYTFAFKITETEANNIYRHDISTYASIPYSIKRYHDGQFLETLVNAKIMVGGTVKWQNS